MDLLQSKALKKNHTSRPCALAERASCRLLISLQTDILTPVAPLSRCFIPS